MICTECNDFKLDTKIIDGKLLCISCSQKWRKKMEEKELLKEAGDRKLHIAKESKSDRKNEAEEENVEE